jgi:hypothetical protein
MDFIVTIELQGTRVDSYGDPEVGYFGIMARRGC